MRIQILFFPLMILTVSYLLGGCNDNSGSDPDTVTLTGAVYASPVSDTQVSVKTLDGDIIAGPVNSDSNTGNYTVEIDKSFLSQALIVESSGNTSASANEEPALAGLATYLAPGKLNTDATVSLTPGTTIIRDLITLHGKTQQEAEDIFQDIFDYLPDISVIPKPGDGQLIERLAAARADAFLQLTTELGLLEESQPRLFDLLLAIAADLADKKADGRNILGEIIDIGSTGKQLPEDIQNLFTLIFTRLLTSSNMTKPSVEEAGKILPPATSVLFAMTHDK